MPWLFHRIEQNIKRRKTQQRCGRCHLFYLKTAVQCPHCSGLDDRQLSSLLEQKVRFKIGLGKGMLGAAVFIIIVLLVLNA